MVLNRMGLDERIAPPAEVGEGKEIFVWSAKGRVVTEALLQAESWVAVNPGGPLGEVIADSGTPGAFGMTPARAVPGGSSTLDPFRVRTLDDLRTAADSGSTLWAPIPRPPVDEETGHRYAFRSVLVWSTTPAELERGTAIYRALAPYALAMIFLGVLILWRAHERGVAAWLTGLWALGAGSLLPFAPIAGLPMNSLIGLHGVQDALLSTIWQGPLGLLGYALYTPLWIISLLLSAAVMSGLLPVALALQWAMPPHRGLGRGFSRRLLARVLGLAMLAVVWWMASRGWIMGTLHSRPSTLIDWLETGTVLVPAVLFYLVYRLARAIVGPGEREVHWAHLVLLGLPWVLVGLAFIASMRGVGWLWVIRGGAWLSVALVAWIVVARNTWGVAGSRASASLAAAVLVPFLYMSLETRTGDALVEWGIISPEATGIATLIVFGLLLRPVAESGRWLTERVMLGRRLHNVVPQVPDMIEALMRTGSPRAREQTIRSILEGPEIGLKRYVLYSRRGVGSGAFVPLVHGFREERFEPPPMALSSELLAVFSRADGFVDTDLARYEPTTSVAAPEFWRLVRRLDAGTRSTDPNNPRWATVPRRVRHVLPLTVGRVVVGLLIVGENELAKGKRSDPFARQVKSVGLASV
ncbi:MAG: hypothetical protein ACF8NJ_05820 [Phycisphaerales bacterium JB038]